MRGDSIIYVGIRPLIKFCKVEENLLVCLETDLSDSLLMEYPDDFGGSTFY